MDELHPVARLLGLPDDLPAVCEDAFRAGSREIGYILAVVGLVGALSQAVLVGRVVHALGEQRTLLVGLLLNIVGLSGAAFTHALPMFYLLVGVASVGARLRCPAS